MNVARRPTVNTRAISAQARAELLLQLRRGENVIVTLAVPLGVLVFFAKVDAVTTDFADPVDFLVPGVLALVRHGRRRWCRSASRPASSAATAC